MSFYFGLLLKLIFSTLLTTSLVVSRFVPVGKVMLILNCPWSLDGMNSVPTKGINMMDPAKIITARINTMPRCLRDQLIKLPYSSLTKIKYFYHLFSEDFEINFL